MQFVLGSLRIDASGVPIYVQLREQLLQAIGSGQLSPGDQLPTMRQVAITLKVDLNTVQRAYASLERDGVLSTLRGRGTFVAQTPPPIDPALRKSNIEGLAYKTIATARSLGIDPEDVARAILKLSDSPSS